MFLKKSATEILKDAARSIGENTPITNFTAGSIARSIIEAMAPEIGSGEDQERVSLYAFAQQVLDQGFISRANDIHLDLIGGLFSYPRRIQQVRNEDNILIEEPISDDEYRYEITQVVPSMATANYAALRLAILSVQGVEDAIGQEYTHGTGSFSFILIPQFGFDEEELVASVQEAIDKNKSFGVRPNIITPVQVPFDLTVKLFFHETVNEGEKNNIRFEVQNEIIDYIGEHELGTGITYNDLVHNIMNVSNKVVDFEIMRFYLNNEPVLLTNHSILEDEQLVPQYIEII